MACKCRKTKASPHTITPGDTCVFCAEKHLSAAEAAIALCPELQRGTRQLIIGELICAYHHLVAGYPRESSEAEQLIVKMLRRASVTLADIQSVRSAVTDLAEQMGEEDTTPGKWSGSFTLAGNNPFIGEKLFCFSWRLAEECGYWKANKGVILGCLSLAQPHLQKYCPEAAGICRDLRHAVQLRAIRQDDHRWVECAELLEHSITPAASQILEKQGDL